MIDMKGVGHGLFSPDLFSENGVTGRYIQGRNDKSLFPRTKLNILLVDSAAPMAEWKL